MKLHVVRNQNQGRMGKVSFELKVRTELTPEENALVKKYRAHKEVLFLKEGGSVGKFLVGKNLSMQKVTIQNLISGMTFKGDNIATILGYEEMIKETCQVFKTYLDTMRSFGGEEVFEF